LKEVRVRAGVLTRGDGELVSQLVVVALPFGQSLSEKERVTNLGMTILGRLGKQNIDDKPRGGIRLNAGSTAADRRCHPFIGIIDSFVLAAIVNDSKGKEPGFSASASFVGGILGRVVT